MMISPVSQAFSELPAFGLWMQKQGYRYSTVLNCIKSLRAIARRTNLLNPEQVKTYLASSQVTENRKDKLTKDLTKFYKYKQIPFDKPHYIRIEMLPFIPTETEVDQLISGLGPKTACFLQLLKETGMRAGEAWNLKWIDIDFERGTVNVTPEKGSRPRQLKISNRLLAMLNAQQRTWIMAFRNPSSNPLKSLDGFRRNFEQARVNLAKKLQNPRIRSTSFKTLRHFKATMEYHRTKDILHVMQLLGHKNIRNTLVYTHLVNFEGDEYVCKVARTVEEARNLIEGGFDYVTDIDKMKLFRKRA
jgi:integrase